MLAECATRLVDDTVEREHDDVAPPLLGRGRDGALRVVPRAARGVGAWEDGIIDGERHRTARYGTVTECSILLYRIFCDSISTPAETLGKYV